METQWRARFGFLESDNFISIRSLTCYSKLDGVTFAFRTSEDEERCCEELDQSSGDGNEELRLFCASVEENRFL